MTIPKSFDWLEQELGFYPWGYILWKNGVTELNVILLNGMHNSWSKQYYVQGFDFEFITFKKAVNMFERMDISESIYEGVVEPSYQTH